MMNDAIEQLLEQGGAGLVFCRRPEAIPADLRLSWRLPALCLVLDRFRGKRSTIENLHVVWWAMRTAETRELFERWAEGRRSPVEIMVRFDPSLSLTVDLAIGQGLAEMSDSGAIVLTSTGMELAQNVWGNDKVLNDEKDFLRHLPRLTQVMMKELLTWQ